MDLVELIKNQLPSGLIDQLTSLTGGSEVATRAAVSAGVPALLKGLSGLASTSGGAQKLVSALGNFDASSARNMANMVSENPSAVQEQGGSLLNSLFGGGLSSIASAVGRFAGLSTGAVQKVLGFLAPMVLGTIAGRFTGKSLTPQGLTSFFSEQKENIASAMPTGFSLTDVPAAAVEATRSTVRTVSRETQMAGASASRWVLPLIGCLALLGLISYLWPRAKPVTTTPDTFRTVSSIPAVSNVNEITSNLNNTFKGMSDSLSGITDPASATQAADRLREYNTRLDEIKWSVDKLPADGRAKVNDVIKSNLSRIEDQQARLLWIPGVGDKIRPVVSSSLSKVAAIGGFPAPQFSQINGDLAGTFASLTATLNSARDSASAEAALPKLTEISNKLDYVKNQMSGVGETGRSTIRSLMKPAIEKLREVSERTLANPGVGGVLKPVVDGIMERLNSIAA